MKNDIGTYHVKIELDDGDGFITDINGAGRYTHGRADCHPLTASYIPPTFDDEQNLIESQIYMFSQGNFSCDCNLKSFLDHAHQREQKSHSCGHEVLSRVRKFSILKENCPIFEIEIGPKGIEGPESLESSTKVIVS